VFKLAEHILCKNAYFLPVGTYLLRLVPTSKLPNAKLFTVIMSTVWKTTNRQQSYCRHAKLSNFQAVPRHDMLPKFQTAVFTTYYVCRPNLSKSGWLFRHWLSCIVCQAGFVLCNNRGRTVGHVIDLPPATCGQAVPILYLHNCFIYWWG
jgi:hypothetical protein